MSTFALKNIDAVVGKQTFDKLIVDGVSLLDEFEDNVEDIYKSEIPGLYASMNQIANLKSLPQTKFHPYSDGTDGCREFEFKSKHLRIYAIEKPGGKIVVLGGTKANQDKDQSKFRKIKEQYLASLKE